MSTSEAPVSFDAPRPVTASGQIDLAELLRLAERAALAAAAATADLARPMASGQEGLILDEIDLERAVIEVTRLRDELTSWMNAYELETGRQPDLTETSESIPEVYGRFVRYVALRDLVRRSSVRMGATPVVWT